MNPRKQQKQQLMIRKGKRLANKEKGLNYDKFFSDCLPGSIISREVQKISELLTDKRRPAKLNLNVVRNWDSLSYGLRSTNDFNLVIELQKKFESGKTIVLLSLAFNCDLVCKPNIPCLPEQIVTRVLLQHLSLKPYSKTLGHFKIDLLGVLVSWFKKVAALDVCTGMIISIMYDRTLLYVH